MTVPIPPSANDSEYRAWRWRHSLWLLAPILGVGVLSFVGFVYCAVKVRERRWAVLATFSVVLTIVGYVLLSTWTNSAGDASNAASAYVFGLWAASVILGFVVNRDYLAWRARREVSEVQTW